MSADTSKGLTTGIDLITTWNEGSFGRFTGTMLPGQEEVVAVMTNKNRFLQGIAKALRGDT